MQQQIESAILENGLVIVSETLPETRAAAFCWLVPAGSVYQSSGRAGTSTLLADLMFRGAGDRDGRELLGQLSLLGVQNEESITPAHVVLSGVTQARNLLASLPVYADILRRPHLPEDELDAARSGLEMTLASNEDDPRQKLTQELRRRTYPAPWGIPSDGELADLPHITMDDVRSLAQHGLQPREAIFSVASPLSLQDILPAVRELFGDWQPGEITPPPIPSTTGGYEHLTHDSQQTQIGIAYPSPDYRHEDYLKAWAAISILSGGMSSRLFTEVREKRGLCYSVSASLHSLKGAGRVLCFASSQNERAQETLDVLFVELARLKEGIADDELARCKALAKSSLVMAQDSASARAGSIARDWYHLGHVRTLASLKSQIDALTVPDLLDYLQRWPIHSTQVLTVGPESLQMSAVN